MSTPPLLTTWTGEAFEPIPRHRRLADAHFMVGQRYTVQIQGERSQAEHDHQFAELIDIWHSLPDHIAEQFPSPDHFRKALLIDAGFFKETMLDAGTNAAALRVAALMRADDEFARVVVRGPLVVRRVAKSQKRAEMPVKEFREAKQKILEMARHLIGIEPEAAA